VAAARRGDRRALEELCRREWRPVYGLVYRAVQDRAEAEDLTQETFLKALQHLDGFRASGAPFRAYLSEVAMNLVRDRWRRRGRRPLWLESLPEVRDRAAGPEATAAGRADRDRIRRALAGLSRDHRMVIVLRILDRKPAAECAALMKRTPAAIRQLQHRALSELRNALSERVEA